MYEHVLTSHQSRDKYGRTCHYVYYADQGMYAGLVAVITVLPKAYRESEFNTDGHYMVTDRRADRCADTAISLRKCEVTHRATLKAAKALAFTYTI